MALIHCHECNGELSTTAKTCPHCGSPVKLDALERTIHNLNVTANRLKAMEELHQANPAAAWARHLFVSVGFGTIAGGMLGLAFHKWALFPKDGAFGGAALGAAIGIVFGIAAGKRTKRTGIIH